MHLDYLLDQDWINAESDFEFKLQDESNENENDNENIDLVAWS